LKAKHPVQSNGRLTVNDDREAAMAYFKILSQHLPGRIEKNYKKTSISIPIFQVEICS
jgi:hypothetical protein